MSRGPGRAQRHVLARLQGGAKLTVAQLVQGYAANGKATAAEYEAVRRAGATLATDGVTALYPGQMYRQGRGGWWASERSAARRFPTLTWYRP